MKLENLAYLIYQTSVFIGTFIIYYLSITHYLSFTSQTILMMSIGLLFFVYMTYTNIFDENKQFIKSKKIKYYLYLYTLPLVLLDIFMIIHLIILFY